MRTREFIIEAIKKLLEKHTFENITVQNIIDEAGVSKPTFYRYFQSKYDLAASVFSESITKNMLMQYDGSNYEEFQNMVFEIIKDNRKYLRRVMKSSGPESFYEFLIKYNKQYIIIASNFVLVTLVYALISGFLSNKIDCFFYLF